MGFEPTRAEPNGLAVHRLKLSDTSSTLRATRAAYTLVSKTDYWENKKSYATRRGWVLNPFYTLVSQTHHWEDKKKLSDSTRIGFEPKRAEPNGLAVHRLNHSTTSSALQAIRAAYTLVSKTYHWENKNKVTRLDEDGIRTHAGKPNGLAVHRLNLSATSSALQAIRAAYTLVSKTDHWENKKKLRGSTRMGFEPTRAEPSGLAVHRLNLSATSSVLPALSAAYTLVSKTDHWKTKKSYATRRGWDSKPRGQSPTD
ncbi:hypothetical protein MRX96_015311 [Rhipicephalus microplus]